MKKFSALVVGGGPAGSSAALGLLRAGWDVTLLEQRNRPQGRVCGAFLRPEAASRLEWLGALDKVIAAGAVPVRRARLTSAAGPETSLDLAQDGRPGYGIPREKLESLLLETVAEAGGRIRTGVRVENHEWERCGWVASGRIGSEAVEFRGRLLVLADGRFSLAGGPAKKPAAGWFGWNAVFDGVPQKPGEMSLHFYPGGYAGVLTFADGSSNVCGLHRRGGSEKSGWDEIFQTALTRQPALRVLLAGTRRSGPWRGTGPLPFGPRRLERFGPFRRLLRVFGEGHKAEQQTHPMPFGEDLGPGLRRGAGGNGDNLFPAEDLFDEKSRGQGYQGNGGDFLPEGGDHADESRDRGYGDLFLAGDAAGVGDPFLGEGIARALAAGPMIHQALTEPAGEKTGGPGKTYRATWKNAFTSRLTLGAAARIVLGAGPLSSSASAFICRKPKAARWLFQRTSSRWCSAP